MARTILIKLMDYIHYLGFMEYKVGNFVLENMEMLVGLSKGVGPFLFETKMEDPSVGEEIAEALHGSCVRMVSWKMDTDETLVLIVEMMIVKAKKLGIETVKRTVELSKPAELSSEDKCNLKLEGVVRLEK